MSPHTARCGEHHTALATLEHALALVAGKRVDFQENLVFKEDVTSIL